MLRPSRVVEQMQSIPFFVGKSSSNCSVCGRPLTAHDSVARGIGPVCVRKHMGPGAHPSGSPQSVHAGKKGERRTYKPLAELVRGIPVKSRRLTESESGIEPSFVYTYGDGTKVLAKKHKVGSAESELMVYEFSKSIGWGIVPETVLSAGIKDVSAQRWVEGGTLDRSGKFPIHRAEIRGKSDRIVIMDQLLGNTDRHGGNIQVDASGKQWAIDNNLAFGPERVWDWSTGVVTGKKYNYGRMYPFGRRVTKDRVGLIDAAKDVRRWFKTPAYRIYVAKLKQTHGEAVARQFGLNVADLADWSRKAKVVE